MPAQPCLTCRKPTTNGARCARCLAGYQAKRNQQRELVGSRLPRNWSAYGRSWKARRAVAIAAQPWCSECGATEDLTLDHARPVSKGGTARDGGQVLCRKCNSSRGNRG